MYGTTKGFTSIREEGRLIEGLGRYFIRPIRDQIFRIFMARSVSKLTTRALDARGLVVRWSKFCVLRRSCLPSLPGELGLRASISIAPDILSRFTCYL